MRKERKAEVVAELGELLAQHPHVVLTGYRGLTVKEMTQFRRALASLGAQVKVIKKTLFQRALAGQAREGLTQHMEGPVAAAFVAQDPVAVVKEMSAFARQHPALELRGGWVEGRLYDGGQLGQLAALPPREELLGQLLGMLMAPLTQFASVVQAGPRDLVLTLQALARQREGQGAAAAGAA